MRYYGQWMRDEAEKRIGHLYPKIEVTAEMARERPDLLPYVGRQLTVIAWLWARTVKSPNPAFAQVDVPLVSTFVLSAKTGKEAYVEPVIDHGSTGAQPEYRFKVLKGKPSDMGLAKNGTRAGKAQDFLCLMSGVPIPRSYIREEGKAGRLGIRLMAIVAEGDRGKVYLAPPDADEAAAIRAAINPIIDEARSTFLSGLTPTRAMITGGVCSAYGLSTWGHLFTPRQLVALTTFSDLVGEARTRVKCDSLAAGMSDDHATSYADSAAVYLAFSVDRFADYWTALGRWQSTNQQLSNMFSRQAIPMVWDFPEANPFSRKGGSADNLLDWTIQSIANIGLWAKGWSECADAATQTVSRNRVVSTDPPYYDNIGYAELSDFFYPWLRRSLRALFPDLFATLTTPKSEELVATPYRHGGQERADAFFMQGMMRALRQLAEQAHPSFPVTIYYAFKQAESDDETGTASTGWETFLDAVDRTGFALTGTWPMRTEMKQRMISMDTNALASSIVLVCRKRPADAPTATRREFVNALKAELPAALIDLQRGNIAPVDLAQAAIGPGMAVYTRYAKVLDAEGKPLSVREALALINQTLDEALAEQEGDFDADSRWALTWFEQQGFAEGEFGVAEQLSKSKNTSVAGMVEAGILESKRGKVRLLPPNELPADWDPAKDGRLTAWECVHQLIRALDTGGESAAANLVAQLGAKAEVARELCYRLYTLCERKKRAEDALAYNGLVQSWPEIVRLARDVAARSPVQEELF